MPSHAGELNPNYRGGTFINHNGYVSQLVSTGKREFQHVIVAEKALGYALPEGVLVHHVNEIKTDNRNQNLVICENAAYHNLLHLRMRWIADGIDPDKEQRCQKCRTVKPFTEFYPSRRHMIGYFPICRKCNQEIETARYAPNVAAYKARQAALAATPPSGKAFAASIANAQRTECIHGHQLAGENLYLYVRNGHVNRSCRTCRLRNSNKRRPNAKEA